MSQKESKPELPDHKYLTLCGGSCKNCPDVVIAPDKTLTISEFGEKVAMNEEQLQMLVSHAREAGFDV